MTAEEGSILVNTEEAAHALRMPTHQLDTWADRGLVVPALVDPDGERWWSLHDLRRQIAAYLDDRDDRDEEG